MSPGDLVDVDYLYDVRQMIWYLKDHDYSCRKSPRLFGGVYDVISSGLEDTRFARDHSSILIKVTLI